MYGSTIGYTQVMDGSSEIRMQNHELCLSLCGLGLDIVGIITTIDSQSICTILLLSNGSNAGSCLLCAIVFTEQLEQKSKARIYCSWHNQ